MGDGSLSQEEIDALLQGADDLSGSVEMEAAPSVSGLSDSDINEMRTIADEVAGSMGMTLSTITGKTVDIKISQIDVVTKEVFTGQFTGPTVQVTADYTEGAPGVHSYIMSEEAARQVAALMMAQEEGELTDMALSALTEGFSQMSGASNNTINNKTGIMLQSPELSSALRETPGDIVTPEGEFVRIRYNFTADGSASFLDEIFDVNVAGALSGSMGKSAGMGMTQVGPQQAAGEPQFQQQPPVYDTGGRQAQMNVGVQPVQFAPLSQAEQPGVTGNIGLLMDVSMQLTVELGRTKMLIKDILGMGEGTIVELDKLAGEPVDLLVNGKLIAKGEVVVIDENFGVRVTDIISPMNRISNIE